MKKAIAVVLLSVLAVAFSAFSATGESAETEAVLNEADNVQAEESAVTQENTAAWMQGDDIEWFYRYEQVSYWFQSTDGRLYLYGKNEELSSGEVIIAPAEAPVTRVVTYGDAPYIKKLLLLEDRLVLQLTLDGIEVNDIIYLYDWGKDGEDVVVTRKHVAQSNTMMDRIVEVGHYKSGESYVVFKTTNDVMLWTSNEKDFKIVTAKKYRSVQVNPLGFFVFSNARGGYALSSPVSVRDEVVEIGDLRKNTMPVNGETYMAYVLKNGQIGYTENGLNITISSEELSRFRNMEIEFWRDRIVLRCSVFLAQLIPGVNDTFVSMSQEEYSRLNAADLITLVQ